MMDRRERWGGRDDPYEEDAEERSPVLDWLLGGLAVVWSLVLHAGVPAALVLAVSTAERLDVFAPLTDAALQQRLGPLGLLLGVVAAVITNYTFTLLGRPFSLGKFLVTAVVIGGAIFPFLAAANRLTLGLTPDQFAVLLSYAYLGLKVAVGVLIGATVSWMLVSHSTTAEAGRPR
jgi:hypothetical protein